MVKQSYLFFLSVLLIVSLVSYSQYNLLPANALLELLVLCSFCVVAKRMALSAWFILGASLVYLIYTYVYARLNGVYFSDYFIAYKAFFYLIFLCFFSGKVLFNSALLEKSFTIFLIIFLIKYLVWMVLVPSDRPGVFTENNFEIMLVLFWGLAVWGVKSKLSSWQWGLLFVVVFLSGSRSGIVSLFAMMCILFIREFDWKTILKILVLTLVGGAVVAVFVGRMAAGGDLNAIDRVVFLQGLIIATQDWGWKEVLVGTSPLTALPDVVCERLQYYKVLFSAKDPSVCYSVILHSLNLRLVHDHGVIGLVFIFYGVWHLLKISQVPSRVALSVIGILVLNALSVSSFNSVYALLGIIIVISSPYAVRLIKINECGRDEKHLPSPQDAKLI